KPRVGVVNCNSDCLGFIFIDYLSILLSVRPTIDELLRQIAPKSMKIEYKFIDRNGWPIAQNQENLLTIYDILVNQNICIKIKSLPDYVCNGHVTEISETFALPASEPIKQITAANDSVDGFFRRPSAIKRNLLKRQTTRRRMDKPFRIKSSKTAAKLIMISYARQEAAQHALVLKKELISFGYSVYLDVDEIRTGTDWQDALNEAVSTCQIFVPLVTPLYGKTQWTNREVKLADILHKMIIPINFLDQWPPECLAIQFATTQYIPWRPLEDITNDKNNDIKQWSEKHARTVAKLIAEQIPTKIPKVPKPPAPSKHQKPLIVISAHPQQKQLVAEVRISLEDSFDVWCTIDGHEMNDFGSLDSLPNPGINLPTIPEGSETVFNENYKAIARAIVESKRPASMPFAETMSSDNRRLVRMMSQISNISQISSLTPDKMDRLKQFETNVAAAKVVIVLASEAYFKSRTSRQHVYYCEHRKNMVLVRCDKSPVPSWFSMLMADESPISLSDPKYIEAIKAKVKRILDPASKENTKEMQELKVNYLVDYLKKNMPVLDTCVYVIGKVNDQRSEEICKAIGAELAKLKNVTLVTNGGHGASDLVTRAFVEAKEKNEVPNRVISNNQFHSSVVHILPLQNSQNENKQNDETVADHVVFGQNLFLGETMRERETAVARLLNTCILIGGGPEDAHEAQEFIWNDHYVIPVISTGGAASGQFGVPFKIFESPVGVQEEDRRNLSNKEATPEQVAKSVVRIVITVKKCIALYKTEASNCNKSAKKSIKKKKPQEKLDTSVNNGESSDAPSSPDQVLPVVDIDLNANRKAKTSGKWKKMQRLITFARHT
ncbi:TIR motif-containing protein-like protein, partial [Dinothrombium tinctorium]